MIRHSKILCWAVLLLLAACSLTSGNQGSGGTAAAPAASSPTSAVVESQAAFATFHDAEGGFSFEYPANWTLLEPPQRGTLYAITFASYNFLDPAFTASSQLPEGHSKYDVYVDLTGQFTSIEAVRSQFLSVQANPGGVPQILAEQARMLASGEQALYLHLNSSFGGEVEVLVTLLNGRVIQVVAYGERVLFDQVAMSLRSD